MTIKHKFKPAARSDIREKVELKFRARGAVAFHLLLVLVGAVLLLYNLSHIWATRFSNSGFHDSILALVVLAATGALHFIRYHFLHGKGRDNHETETEARIARQLQRTAPEDAAEQEVLIRLQQDDKLKNRRLVWQHLALFVSIVSLMFLLNLSIINPGEIIDWANWQGQATYTGVWGIGLVAHILRYLFAYRVSSGRREAKIEQQLVRELRRERRQQELRKASRDQAQDDDGQLEGALSLEDLEVAQERSRH